MEKKLAIILSGGGMTCSYSAGYVCALAKEHGLTSPDIMIAGSGGAGTASYYVTGQYDSIKNIWTNLLATRKFINPFRFWRVIDIDYVVDEVFKLQDPLDVNGLHKKAIHFYIPVTNAGSGTVSYLDTSKDCDVFEALRATKAMPIIYGKKVNIKGVEFCDTQLSSSVGLHIKKALRLGANKVLVISNEKDSDFYQRGYGLWIRSKGKEFRNNYLELQKKMKSPPQSLSDGVLWITPIKKIKAGLLDNSRESLEKTFDQGYRECCENKELRTFIS